MKSNPQINQLIQILKEKAYQEEVPLWRDLALKLEKSTRSRAQVNISKINRHSSPDETILVPGKVLGSGAIDHKVQVAALDFSLQAVKKILDAGGECVDITLLLEENPKGNGVRIIK
jgi:large subunit ribosomal protein L18e